MKVFLTGATGLLGSNIASELINRNHEVKALVRNIERGRKLINSETILVEGDLNNISSFSAQLSGCDVLIHAGSVYGEFYKTENLENLFKINVQSTLQLLDEAYQKGIRNVVYISSSAVLKSLPNRQTDESNPYNEETTDPYFKSKVDAEKAVLRFSRAHSDMRIVFILPSVMLGPGDSCPSPTGKFMLNFLKGNLKFNLPGTMCIVDVRDVANAVVEAIVTGGNGERYLVGGNLYTLEKLFNTLADVSGKARLPKTISAKKLLFLSYIMLLISKISGKKPPLKPGIIKRLTENFSYSSLESEKVLKVKFRPISITMKDMYEWFQQKNMID